MPADSDTRKVRERRRVRRHDSPSGGLRGSGNRSFVVVLDPLVERFPEALDVDQDRRVE